MITLSGLCCSETQRNADVAIVAISDNSVQITIRNTSVQLFRYEHILYRLSRCNFFYFIIWTVV